MDEKPWMVATDVCKIFGCTNPSKAVKDAGLDVDECKTLKYKALNQTAYASLWTDSDFSDKTLINEAGLYSLLFSLKPNKARGISDERIAERTEKLRQFKHWVTSEVLPSIRKSGGYMATNGTETDEELMARALAVAQETMKRRDERIRQLESVNEEQQHLIEEKDKQIKQDYPKVTFANAVSGSTTSILIGELAKILRQNGVKDMGEKRLFAWLRDNHYLGTVGERYNVPNQQYIEQGLFELKTNTFSVNGEMKTRSTTKVTGKGQQYFVNKFLNQAS